MVHLNTLSVATLVLYSTTVAALPRPFDSVLGLLGMGGSQADESKYPAMKIRSDEGVFPAQPGLSTGTDEVAPGRNVFIGPTGTGGVPAPTGGAWPGFKHGDHNKQKGSKKKHHKKPQGLAQPAGADGSLAPTRTSPDGAADGIQKRQFEGARQQGFQAHWAGSPAGNDTPTPTGSGVAAPTGTGGLFPGFMQGKRGIEKRGSDEERSEKKRKSIKNVKRTTHGSNKHKKPQGLAQPTGTGGLPAPTRGFSSGGSSEGLLTGVQKRQFGNARRDGFQPHWVAGH